MRDPRRLLEGDASELERSLLTLVQSECAPPAATQRLVAQLGLSSAGLGLAHAGAVAKQTGASSIVPPAALGSGAGLLSGLTGKLLLAALISGAGGAAWLGLVSFAPETARVEPRMPATEHVVPVAPETAEVAPAASQLAPPAVPAPKRGAEASGLSREVAALAAVRALLKAGDASGALYALDVAARERPRSVLEQEATALRIEALLAGHQVADAQTLAERFLRAHPNSPHVARVRALVRAPKAER
jgi:hypothetical protein